MKNPAEDQPVPPPTDGAAPQPTLPLDDGVLWLVSFADDDDRELRPPDIAESLRRGEIDAETIVWRDGMEDWVPLGGVPSLARLLPSTGETANAPLVISNHGTTAPAPTVSSMTTASSSRALVPRAKGNEPSKPSAKVASEVTKKSDGADGPLRGPDAATTRESATDAAGLGTVATATTTAPGGTTATATAPGGTTATATAPGGTTATATAPGGTTATAGTSAKRDSKPPVAAAKTAEPWRGKTRLGLPQPPEIKRIPGPGPSGKMDGATTAKKPDARPQTPNASKVAIAGTPTVPKAAVARTPNAPRVRGADAPASTKGGAANIWDDEQDGPISVDPESIRPLSPTPSLVNATALSRGTLGNLPRKPPPPAPRPPAAKPAAPGTPDASGTPDAAASGASGTNAAPGIEKRSHSETPAIAQLAGPLRTPARVDDAIANLGGGGGMSAALLAPPAMDLAAFGEDPVFSAEGPPIDAIEVPVVEHESATVPKAAAVAPRATNAASSTAKPTTASASSSTAAAQTKKRSVLPFVLGGAAVLYALSLVMKKPPEEAPPAAAPAVEQESPRLPEPQAAIEPGAAPSAAAPAPEPALPSAPAAPEPTGGVAAASRVVGSHAEATAVAKPAANSKPEGDKPTSIAKKPETETKPTPALAPEPEPKQVDMGGDFDKAAAGAALGTAASQASGCRKDGDPTGVAVVHVTFANSGRATRATIEGPPFAGTPTGGCIAAALRGAKVPPFGGDRVTVTKRVVIQ